MYIKINLFEKNQIKNYLKFSNFEFSNSDTERKTLIDLRN